MYQIFNYTKKIGRFSRRTPFTLIANTEYCHYCSCLHGAVS